MLFLPLGPGSLIGSLRLGSGLKGEPEGPHEVIGLLVRFCCCPTRNVHAPNPIDLIVVDLRKDDLFGDAEAIVPPAIEGLVGEAAKIPDPGYRQAEEAIQEFIHSVTA